METAQNLKSKSTITAMFLEFFLPLKIFRLYIYIYANVFWFIIHKNNILHFCSYLKVQTQYTFHIYIYIYIKYIWIKCYKKEKLLLHTFKEVFLFLFLSSIYMNWKSINWEISLLSATNQNWSSGEQNMIPVIQRGFLIFKEWMKSLCKHFIISYV